MISLLDNPERDSRRIASCVLFGVVRLLV